MCICTFKRKKLQGNVVFTTMGTRIYFASLTLIICKLPFIRRISVETKMLPLISQMLAFMGTLLASFKLVENLMILRWSYLQFYTYNTDAAPMSICCTQKKKTKNTVCVILLEARFINLLKFPLHVNFPPQATDTKVNYCFSIY